MGWTVLIIAGIFEIIWVVALKYSEGMTRLLPSMLFFIAAALSFACLSYALKLIPMGTAYAVWTGIGAVGVAIFGMLWFNESVTTWRVICIGLIVVGILGLKILSGGSSLGAES